METCDKRGAFVPNNGSEAFETNHETVDACPDCTWIRERVNDNGETNDP